MSVLRCLSWIEEWELDGGFPGSVGGPWILVNEVVHCLGVVWLRWRFGEMDL